MIEKESHRTTCAGCDALLPSGKNRGKKRRFCSISCYDKYRREHDYRKRLKDNLRSQLIKNEASGGKLMYERDNKNLFRKLSREIDELLEKNSPDEVKKAINQKLRQLRK